LLDAGNAKAAAQTIQRAFPRASSSLAHLSAACAIYQASDDHDRAAFYARRATHVAPGNADVWANLGLILASDPRARDADLKSALTAYERAHAIEPSSANIATGYANALMRARRFGAALDVCSRSEVPATAALLTTRASLLAALWRTDEAIALLSAAHDAYPEDPQVLHALLVNLQVADGVDPDDLARLHKRLGALWERTHAPLPLPRPAPTDVDRPLRVGFLSPDLRRHSVASFALPLFANLPRDAFTVLAYSTSPVRDTVTDMLRAHAHEWTDASAMHDDALCARIAADRVDILIDLAGLSQGGRLGVLARRPAPMQATYCGYPDTTGLSRVGLRIVDAITDPPGDTDSRASEQLARIEPVFLCYQPLADAPPVGVRPADAPLVFGSFNALRKINARTLDLWTRVLESVPGSRLAIKSLDLDIPEVAACFERELERRGLCARVDVLPPAPSTRDHLDLYSRVDVALDPFPYHGTTTTCEALWMGVPVVALAGRTHASRVGASLLSAAGHADWIATDSDAFVRIARGLAADRGALALTRATLRDTVARSALCDGVRFGVRFGAALREHWAALCAST
jgi:predicted O-linked N-acetylglucosamine transferase (SPINDLY family)